MECDNRPHTVFQLVTSRVHSPKTTRQSSTKFGTAIYTSILLCTSTLGNTINLLKHILHKDSMQSGSGVRGEHGGIVSL